MGVGVEMLQAVVDFKQTDLQSEFKCRQLTE